MGLFCRNNKSSKARIRTAPRATGLRRYATTPTAAKISKTISKIRQRQRTRHQTEIWFWFVRPHNKQTEGGHIRRWYALPKKLHRRHRRQNFIPENAVRWAMMLIKLASIHCFIFQTHTMEGNSADLISTTHITILCIHTNNPDFWTTSLKLSRPRNRAFSIR